jgi:hypothetical protein
LPRARGHDFIFFGGGELLDFIVTKSLMGCAEKKKFFKKKKKKKHQPEKRHKKKPKANVC